MASGAQGGTGKKGAPAGSPWNLDREDVREGRKSKMNWLIHGLGLLPAVYSSIPCCFFCTSMSDLVKGFDSC